MISTHLYLSRSFPISFQCCFPACMFSCWPRTRSYLPSQMLQYFWIYLVPQPRPLFNKGACVYYSDGYFLICWDLFKLCCPNTMCLLWPNHPHGLPNSPPHCFSMHQVLPWRDSSLVCCLCLAIKYDLAYCFVHLCPPQYPPQKLQQQQPRLHDLQALLVDCHSWKLHLVLGPWIPFYRTEHV